MAQGGYQQNVKAAANEYLVYFGAKRMQYWLEIADHFWVHYENLGNSPGIIVVEKRPKNVSF